MFNAYQKDFDIGATRDSDYIYGPSRPRTYTFGIKLDTFINENSQYTYTWFTLASACAGARD